MDDRPACAPGRSPSLAIGVAQRWFDRESPWIQYASQSAYWVYLVHMPLVLLAGWTLVP